MLKQRKNTETVKKIAKYIMAKGFKDYEILLERRLFLFIMTAILRKEKLEFAMSKKTLKLKL